MLHSFVSTAPYAAFILAACALYIQWKMRGGNLLFRFKKNDSGSTTFWKAVLYLGWTYGSMLVAMALGAVSALWLLVALIALAFGG